MRNSELNSMQKVCNALPCPGETVPGAQVTKECLHPVHATQESSPQHAQTGESGEAEERQQYQFYMQGQNLNILNNQSICIVYFD